MLYRRLLWILAVLSLMPGAIAQQHSDLFEHFANLRFTQLTLPPLVGEHETLEEVVWEQHKTDALVRAVVTRRIPDADLSVVPSIEELQQQLDEQGAAELNVASYLLQRSDRRLAEIEIRDGLKNSTTAQERVYHETALAV